MSEEKSIEDEEFSDGKIRLDDIGKEESKSNEEGASFSKISLGDLEG